MALLTRLGGTARLGLLVLAFGVAALGTLVVTGTSNAELDDVQQTWWGLKTKGDSATVAQWSALSWAIDEVDDVTFVGGNFLDVTNGASDFDQPYLAAFNSRDGRWLSWFRPDVGNAVFALEPSPDGGLFVGGEMGTWNGVTRGALVKIDPVTGEAWPGWTTRIYGGGSVIRDLKIEPDGKLYVVGDFKTAAHNGSPQAVSGAVRLDPVTGAIDGSWQPNVSGGVVWGVSASQTKNLVYLSGDFIAVNGHPNSAGFVGTSRSNGSVVVDRTPVPINNCTTPGYCTFMFDVEATAEGLIFVAGVEHTLYAINEDDSSLAYQHYTGCSPDLNSLCAPADWVGGEFQEITVAGDRVYATCHCWTDMWSDTSFIRHKQPHGQHSRIRAVAAFDPATGAHIPQFAPYLSGDSAGFALHVDDDDQCLWIGGGFSAVGAPGAPQAPANGLIRLCDEAGPAPSVASSLAPPPVASCSTTVSADGSSVTVNWPAATGADAYVVERTRSGGGTSWRGAPAGTSFTDSLPGNVAFEYGVKARYKASMLSAATVCDGPVRVNAAAAPQLVSCSAVVVGDQVEITWPLAVGASEYRIRRADGGGAPVRRGTVDQPVLSFDDQATPGVSHTYSLVAVSAGGAFSAARTCGSAFTVPLQPARPASCGSTRVGTTADISWSAVQGAASYEVFRSDAGGPFVLDARLTAPVAGHHTSLQSDTTSKFSVVSIGVGGAASSPRGCGLGLAAPPLVLPSGPCTAVAGVGSATVTWSSAPNGSSYSILRSADGLPGVQIATRSAGTTSATIDLDLGERSSFSVVAVDGAGRSSIGTWCSGTVDPVPPAPIACSVEKVGNEAVITWDAVGNISSYVVYRRPNGGVDSWRGLVSAGTESFTDDVPNNSNLTYSVESVSADDTRSERTVCGGANQAAGPPTACSVTAAGTTATVSWTNGPGATSHIVRRMVDGGSPFWRGRVDAPTSTFADPIWSGPTFAYTVEAKFADGTRSAVAVCAPPVQVGGGGGGGGGGFGPPASCSVTVSGSSAVVSWSSVGDASSYVVRRSVNGGSVFWRGRVDAPATTFTDGIYNGATFAFRVEAKKADGTPSAATVCAPPVQLGGGGGFGAPASCAVTVSGSSAVVSWSSIADASSYVVRRSVNGGQTHWRGRVNAPTTTFTDGLYNGATFEFHVQAKKADGTLSTAKTCAPPVQLP